MQDVYAIVTERILALLEKGVVPWHKPWQSHAHAPRNLVSGREYRGVNVFLLHSMGCQSPFWVTFKQARELGGHVRQGEKACPVVFWKWIDTEDQESGKAKRVPFLRYFSVFNVSQCEGLEDKIPLPGGPTHPHDPIQAAERIFEGMPNRPDIREGTERAFYSPGGDFVALPSRTRFDKAEDFYSVLFHELTHATGHQSRLNRKGVGGSDGEWSAFGSTPYAKEELVAEMGAAFLCGEAGIVERTLDNSAAYIDGWLDRLKRDARLVVQAAAQAQKAADYILRKSQAGSEVVE